MELLSFTVWPCARTGLGLCNNQNRIGFDGELNPESASSLIKKEIENYFSRSVDWYNNIIDRNLTLFEFSSIIVFSQEFDNIRSFYNLDDTMASLSSNFHPKFFPFL